MASNTSNLYSGNKNMSTNGMLSVDPAIATMFHSLIQFPEGVQLFCQNVDTSSRAADRLISLGAKLSGLSEIEAVAETFNDKGFEKAAVRFTGGKRNYYRPKDKFHLAFSVMPFDVDFTAEDESERVKPRIVQDRMMLFNCSEGKHNREVPEHMLGLESLLMATFAGGYFASVLPKRWIGREMKYLRWWEENAALVARIRLPESAVYWKYRRTVKRPPEEIETELYSDNPSWRHSLATYIDDKPAFHDKFFKQVPHELTAPGEWDLYIWFRPFIESEDTPNSNNNRAKLDWAEFRYSPFQFTLETLSNQSIDECAEVFRKHEWWINSIKMWKRMLEKNHSHPWCGTHGYKPHELPDISELWFFKPNEETENKVHIMEDVDAIKKERFAVQIKPSPSKIKIIAFNDYSRGFLMELKASEGLRLSEEDGQVHYNFVDENLKGHYISVREKLAHKISSAGLMPCITRVDHERMIKQERWLNIQLTPIERNVPVDRNQNRWETIYEETGMNAVFPEIMEMWRKRALSMKMDQYLYGFQLEDVIYHAAKDSILNGNVMGLGKTRELLFSALLRGSERVLIVCPTKLIGTWQDEIDDTILPYVRRVRRNWMGKIIHAGQPNVIEYAEDCLEQNLTLFNIISYDTLKRTPKDGRFFICPECDTVTYSPYGSPQICPGSPTEDPDLACNAAIRKWREECRKRDEHGKLIHQKYKVEVSTGKKVHWNPDHPSRKDIPESDVKIIDTRPEKPAIPRMEMQEKMFDKMKKVLISWDVNEETGVRTPNYKVVKRKGGHLQWTFANLLRNKFNYIMVDEILYAKNVDSLRSKALTHLCATHRAGATGTPMKGMPQGILNYLNWIFDRSVMPDYRLYEKGGLARFLKKYKTEVRVDATILPDGSVSGGKPKQIPKINNPELFQAEIAPLMRRHTRNDPSVTKYIPKKNIEREDLKIEMDPEHKAYYKQWLDKFAEWWQMMKEEEEGKNVPKGQLITKLSYLIGASTNPHHMLERISKSKDKEFKAWALTIRPYKGPPTAKMKKCQEIIEAAIKSGDKSIVFSTRRNNLDRGQAWCKKKGYYSMIIDGRVSLKRRRGESRSKRHIMVDKFRNYDYNVMWGGLTALAEGMNIPEANHGIIFDYSWEPSDAKQAIGRMIRPQQTKTVYSYFLMHEGTIDEYMAALCYLKGRSHDEGVDYMEFDDFSTDIIPDIHQYADAIVDGTENVMKRTMWLAVEHIKRQMEEEGEDETEYQD